MLSHPVREHAVDNHPSLLHPARARRSVSARAATWRLTNVPRFATDTLGAPGSSPAPEATLERGAPRDISAVGTPALGCDWAVRRCGMLQSFKPAAPGSYDAIVVLGAAVWPGEQPSPALQRRVLHAVDLLRCGAAPYLLVTGGLGNYPPAEAEVMRRLALAHGIPSPSIVLEDQATSTLESALRCRVILQQRGWSRVLVVTDRYHLARALLAFRGCGIHAAGSGVPGKPAQRLRQRWYSYLREWLALMWYLGRLVPVTVRRWRQVLGCRGR